MNVDTLQARRAIDDRFFNNKIFCYRISIVYTISEPWDQTKRLVRHDYNVTRPMVHDYLPEA